jgi:hypothetical protein
LDAVCLTIDGDRPRAWVASVREGNCTWRALPRAEGVIVDFDPWWFEARCVHAAGNIYWHICNSSRLLQLDPCTLDFSFMPVPAVLGIASRSTASERRRRTVVCAWHPSFAKKVCRFGCMERPGGVKGVGCWRGRFA